MTVVSNLGNLALGLLGALFFIFIQGPLFIYIAYVLLIPFGGLRVWANGWGNPRNVFKVSRFLSLLIGSIALLAALNSTESTSSAGSDRLNSWFTIGFLFGAVAVQAAVAAWQRYHE